MIGKGTDKSEVNAAGPPKSNDESPKALAPLYIPVVAGARAGVAEWIETPAGDRVRVAIFHPTGASRGSVIFSVGRSEPIEKYGEFATEVTARGFTLLIQEWAGQGLSGRYARDPLRAHVAPGRGGGWQRHLSNLDHILDTCASRLPKPWIACGHSMGGGLIALALTRGASCYAAAILVAPMIAPATRPVPPTLAAAITKIVTWAGFGEHLARPQSDFLGVPFERNLLTRDRSRYEQFQDVLRRHPALTLGQPTWAWVKDALSVRRELRKANTRIGCPVALIAAEKDAFVDNRAMKSFAARQPLAFFLEVSGAFHEILMETDGSRSAFWKVFEETVAGIAVRRTS